MRDAPSDANLLDFGCGYGHVSLLFAKFSRAPKHIYGCDTDEGVLDVLWKRIAERELKNVTAFHIPNYSQIALPGWLPPIHYVVCSFSVSALEYPEIELPQLAEQVAVGTQFLFVEWHPERSLDPIDIFVPPATRILPEDFRELVQRSGLTVTHEEQSKLPYYIVRARKDEPLKTKSRS